MKTLRLSLCLLVAVAISSAQNPPASSEEERTDTLVVRSGSKDTAELEKERRKIVGELKKLEQQKIPSLERLRTEKDREGKDLSAGDELLKEAKDIIASLVKAAQDSDPQALINAWASQKEELPYILKDAETAYKKSPMRKGVTKKDIQKQRDEADKLSGCDQFMPLDDRYVVCKSRGLPPQVYRHQRPMQEFVPDTLSNSEVPRECQGNNGFPIWRFAPTVECWEYRDDIRKGPEYYCFLDDFSGRLMLQAKSRLTHNEILQAFVASCRDITAPGGMKLAYVGPYAIDFRDFLEVIFQNSDVDRPLNAFGPDNMIRTAQAAAPPPPFTLEAFMFDGDFRFFARETSKAVSELEAHRTPNTPLAEHAAPLSKEFFDSFEKGLVKRMQEGENHYQAAANAIHASLILIEEDELYFHAVEHEKTFKALGERFEKELDARIKAMMSSRPKAEEFVFRGGEQVFPFLLTTGSPNPKLKLTLRVVEMAKDDAGNAVEKPVGTITRSYEDSREGRTALHLRAFANDDYRRHIFAFFPMPFIVTPTGSRFAEEGVVLEPKVLQNAYVVVTIPGNYKAYLEVVDDVTHDILRKEILFSVVP